MNRSAATGDEWKNTNIQVFWGEIAPCDHLVQVYENDHVFLDTLEGFAGTGLLADDTVIIIATKAHLDNLNERLTKQGFDLDKLISTDRYIPIEAKKALEGFMVDNWPDDVLFSKFISDLMLRATRTNKKVRAFGEMVAILWEQGFNGATVRLEHLWNELHSKKSFTLYCAYPKNGFTQCPHDSIDTICETHSKVIDGTARPATEIYYRTVR